MHAPECSPTVVRTYRYSLISLLIPVSRPASTRSVPGFAVRSFSRHRATAG